VVAARFLFLQFWYIKCRIRCLLFFGLWVVCWLLFLSVLQLWCIKSRIRSCFLLWFFVLWCFAIVVYQMSNACVFCSFGVSNVEFVFVGVFWGCLFVSICCVSNVEFVILSHVW
jgi:hypothetical protein